MEVFDYLGKIFKKAQTPGLYDVCDGCIYNQNNKCVFEGDPRMAQLPMGCPKRPDTQKVFELAEKMIKQGDEILEEKPENLKPYLHFLQKNIDAMNKILPESLVSRFALDIESRKLLEDYADQSMDLANYCAALVEDRELERMFHKLSDLVGTMSQPQISYADSLLDDIIYELGKRADFDKKAQQFAPGPGPWEGSTTNEFSEEVSRSTPERWDAGPLGRRFLIPVHTECGISPSRIARFARILSRLRVKSIADTAQNLPEQINSPQEIACPYCNHKIPASSITCPVCGQQVKTASTYKLCYFCGQPIMSGMNFTLVLNRSDKEIVGASHLECAQTAADQYQGEFDENDDFVLVEDAEKESIEEESGEIEANDEVILVKPFGDRKEGDIGRVVSKDEAQEAGFSPIRVDDKVYVKFDKSPHTIDIVPLDYLEKTSVINGFIKQALAIPCPKGYVPTVLVVMDHCYMASDDPREELACHDKTCKYNRPISKAEWDRLVEKELSSPFSIIRRVF